MELETGTQDLIADVTDGIATVRLNRPERQNALSPEILANLGPLIARIEQNPDARVLVLTGAGRAFCAGGDVKSFHASGGMNGPASSVNQAAVSVQQEQQRAIVGGLRSLRVPVIASMPGAAAGAGIGLALTADLRIGTPRSVFVPAFVNVGLPGDFATAWQLHDLLGRSKAAELILLGDRVDADAAVRIGLLNRIVPEEELEQRTREVAAHLATSPRLAIAHATSNARDAAALDLFTAMDAEVVRHHECAIDDEHRQAVAAFMKGAGTA